MKNESRVKQHYAITDEGKIIHISEAKNIDEEVYCIHCGCKMIKKCGEHNTWHFAHNPNDITIPERNCSYESYLHSLAKIKIKQWFEESPEILILYRQKIYCSLSEKCIWTKTDNKCYKIIDGKYNLKKSLTECRVEVYIRCGREYFVPDLLWINPVNENNKILIEIKVTHGCTQLKRNSGARIIEFEVQTEEDIENIVSSKFIRKSNIVHFYGIPNDRPVDDYTPQYNLIKYVQYINGSVYPQSICNCKDFSMRRPKTCVEITARTENGNIDNSNGYKQISYSLFYKWCAAFVKRCKGIPNCYLCRYRCFNEENNKLQCSIDKREIKGAKAQECIKYSEDITYCNELFESFKYYLTHNPIDIWIDGKSFISE